ncbi:MAG TPA: hypothetical protein VMH78_03965, partial [Thermoplasmata archaeon]|nr:hypothetical protein [Thermoplasmata archaeon]
GPSIPPEIAASLATLGGDAPPALDWTEVASGLSQLMAWARAGEEEIVRTVATRAHAYTEWAGLAPAEVGAVDARVEEATRPIAAGDIGPALDAVSAILLDAGAAGKQRRDAVRSDAEAIQGAGRELGVPIESLEAALAADASAGPLDWATTAAAVERAAGALGGALRERVGQVFDSLRQTLEALREYDVDPTESIAGLEDLRSRLPGAGASALPTLLAEARSETEEPVVGVVASLLDAVRPKLVEARRLGRDATEVFAAMNRAREALRLKIYGEALAASQEAMDRVAQLTGDLDGARAEADSLRALLGRLSASKFPVATFEESLRRVDAYLARTELDPARELLAQTIGRLGAETVAYFSDRFATLERIVEIARERGFLPDDAGPALAGARRDLEEGRLAEAAAGAAALEARLRTAAGPYVARRVEELESGFREIPDASLVGPVQRLLADADVALRVKEDLTASFESLRRAEREFAAVFAAHASTLVEMLEEERSVLESMGGTGDEIQRQIDEVQQIFNMGDFVKASRTSQEIRTRAQQQQLVRSEEAVSHAKLAVIELGKMGLDVQAIRTHLDASQEAARDRRYAEAYRSAHDVLESATQVKTAAQRVQDALATASGLWQELKRAGLAVDDQRERLAAARSAYQRLDFDGALGSLSELTSTLARRRDETEARRLIDELRLLAEDAHRLGVAGDAGSAPVDAIERTLAEGRAEEAVERSRAAHRALVDLLRPVLADHLRTVEQDVDVARSAGLELPDVEARLAESRRRLGLPVPTGVAELLERARADLLESRGLLEHAERVVRRAREAVTEAELVRVDVGTTRSRLETAEAALGRREYARAIQISTDLERDMIQATSQQVGRTLAGFQAMVAKARHEGSDTAVAENYLKQARGALEAGRAVEALGLAARSETEVERVELQLRLAEGCVASLERHLGEAHGAGLRSAEAEAEMEKARAAYADHRYPDVLEHAIAGGEAIDAAREGFRRSREALDAVDRQVKLAVELGAEVQPLVGALDRARHAHAEGAYAQSTQLARETAEGARWAVDRLYTSRLGEVRPLLETATRAGATAAAASATADLDAAEIALKAREYAQANVALDRAAAGLRTALDALLEERAARVRSGYAGAAEGTPEELALREEFGRRLAEERSRGAFDAALADIAAEEARLASHRRTGLERSLGDLKDRLWIGERLGLDTTPSMELFSEATIALETGRLDEVDRLVPRVQESLDGLVAGRLGEKIDELQTELTFSREGLHVAVDSIAEAVGRLRALRAEGKTLLAARALLEAEEELARRKALHRELLNLHYLVDAALARAAERHLDTSGARALLEASIAARATDYPLALAKAREALQLLQGQLKGSETPSGFWALRRPPPG